MSWSSNHDASIAKLEQVQGSLTVGLIMVPREDLLDCSPQQTAAEVKKLNVNNYSSLPVRNETGDYIGLYDAQRWFSQDAPDTPIADDFQPLSEAILVGADASIFEFIKTADYQPTSLVVSGNQISGLISISDLQQLPVRAALFALITSLEMAMALAIDFHWGNDAEAWLSHLSKDQQNRLRKDAKRAKTNDTFVSFSILTQFSHKTCVTLKLPNIVQDECKWNTVFDELRKLRNSLAHADCYADNLKKAKDVCRLAREVFRIKELLSETIPLEKGANDA